MFMFKFIFSPDHRVLAILSQLGEGVYISTKQSTRIFGHKIEHKNIWTAELIKNQADYLAVHQESLQEEA